MQEDVSNNQLKKNFLSLTVVQIATYILPLISVPIVSRIIGPEKYGIINFSAAYVTYFTLIISYSFDFTATRKIAKNPSDEKNRNLVFSEVFYTQCILFTLSTVIFIILLYNVQELKSNKTVVVYSYLVCISTLFTQNWLFQAMQNLSKVAMFNIISRVLFTTFIIITVHENSDYIWQPLLIGIIQSLVAIWSFTWAIKKYNIRFVKISVVRCFKVLWENRVIFFSLIFVNFYSSTNTVILGLYQSSEQVGYYTAGQRLIVIAQSVLTMPLAQALYPFIGKAFGESREKGLRVSQNFIPLIIMFTGIAAIIMFIIGPWLIRIFYGTKFEQAIPVFQLLTAVPLFFSLNNVLGVQIMLNLGMDKDFFKVTAGAGILSIVLNLLMVKKWGYMGTTVNWLVTEIFIFISFYIILKSKKLNPIDKKYFKILSIKENLQFSNKQSEIIK